MLKIPGSDNFAIPYKFTWESETNRNEYHVLLFIVEAKLHILPFELPTQLYFLIELSLLLHGLIVICYQIVAFSHPFITLMICWPLVFSSSPLSFLVKASIYCQMISSLSLYHGLSHNPIMPESRK